MTNEQIQEHHNKVDENIRKYGYNVTFVFAGKAPSFCYSTGIYRSFGIPELFISSLPQNLSHNLVENYVKKFKETKSIPLGNKIDDLIDRFPVYLMEVPVEQLTDYVLSSIRFYENGDFRYLQLIYPDTKGRFPDDIGYDYDQIIMGQFKR